MPRHHQSPGAGDARHAIRRDGRSIVLVGLMGVGKSTVGRRLARHLALPFIDADEAIEQAAGQRIADIFACHGEAYFRDGERRVIRRLMEEGPCVLATGGGAFVDADTRALILARGIAVWMNADIEVLAERVGRRATRPLLIGRDPASVLRDLAATRNPLYALAPVHVVSGVGPHEATARAIIEAVASHLTGAPA